MSQSVMPAPATIIPWWKGAVIYQIYPRSFADSNGDGIGDLAGITAHLDYVASLGVDAIWLSPFFKSPMKDFGYDVEDYCAVDPMFGTIADFESLVAKAHGLGLKVMIDQVLSHTSNQHPWFQESCQNRDNAKADYYVWADPKPDGTPPNNWLSIFGGPAWAWEARRKQYYLHNFLTEQPDLNFHNPDVRQALYDSIRFWMARGVDGFRLDTVNYFVHDAQLRDNPPAAHKGALDVPDANPYGWQEHIYDKSRPENLEVLKELRAVFNEGTDIAAVGEVGAGNEANALIAQYTDGDDRMHLCYGFELLGGERCDPAAIRKAVEGFERQGKGWICWSFSNHDVMRVVTRWGGEADADAFAPLISAMMLCLRGSQCLYQGEELALGEADVPYEALQDPYGKAFWPQFKGRDGCRTPMPWTDSAGAGFSTSDTPWLPIPEDHRARAVSVQEKQPNSCLHRFRQILRWRKAHPVLLTGAIRFLPAPETLLAFLREDETGGLLCVFNPGREMVRFDTRQWPQLRRVEGHGFPSTLVDGIAEIPGYSALFGAILPTSA